MKIGIIGTRGIPNAYGGFEQFAQHLAQGLVKRNHQVFVYNSSDHPYQEKEWNGISILVCKDWEGKIGTAGQFLYDFNCLQDARKRKFDVLLHLGYTSDSIWHSIWPRGTVNTVNMDGLEWKRSKYNKVTRRFLKLAEGLAINYADILIADSEGIRDYISHEYQKASHYIPYGADIPVRVNDEILTTLKIDAANYFLLVARMESENNIEMIIEGTLQSGSAIPLVVVGSTMNKYGRYVKKKYANEKISFAGPIYDHQLLNSLRTHALLYFHGHSVGGTNPSLLEAMACGCTIAAHSNIFNRSVLEEAAFYFSSASDIRSIIQTPVNAQAIRQSRSTNLEKIRNTYNWERIVDEYEKVFLATVKAG